MLRTRDQQAWEVVLAAGVSDLAAHPADPGLLLAVTADGLLRTDRERPHHWAVRTLRAAAARVADPDLLVGISTNGGLHASTDQGRSWTTWNSLL